MNKTLIYYFIFVITEQLISRMLYIYNNIETVLRTLFHLIMDRSYMAMNNAFPNYLLDTIQYENKWLVKRTFIYTKKKFNLLNLF